MTTLLIEELESHLREVIARVQAGETVLVVNDGGPVVQIAPCDPMDAAERAFPGMKRPTKRMSDVRIERVPLSDGSDILDVLREVRDDRDLLP